MIKQKQKIQFWAEISRRKRKGKTQQMKAIRMQWALRLAAKNLIWRKFFKHHYEIANLASLLALGWSLVANLQLGQWNVEQAQVHLLKVVNFILKHNKTIAKMKVFWSPDSGNQKHSHLWHLRVASKSSKWEFIEEQHLTCVALEGRKHANHLPLCLWLRVQFFLVREKNSKAWLANIDTNSPLQLKPTSMRNKFHLQILEINVRKGLFWIKWWSIATWQYTISTLLLCANSLLYSLTSVTSHVH